MRVVTILHKHRFSKSALLSMFLLVIILIICVSIGLSYSHLFGFVPASRFVSARGRRLFLDGHPFRFVGVNRYNLLSSGHHNSCGESWTYQELDHYFAEMKRLNITAIRFWAFQYFTNGTDFSAFDYLISLSDKYGIKLIPTLENQWSDCTQGGYRYDSWYRSGYLAPYGNYRLSFKNYLKIIVPRYKNNQEIMMWQIMNEAESKDINNNQDFQALFMGEAGIKSHCTGIGCYTQQQRADLFRAKMNAFFREGGVGYLLWSYRDNYPNLDQIYEFDASDPLAQVVKSFAS